MSISNCRNKLNDEYLKQATAVFQQWESDLEKTKDQEEKLTVSKGNLLNNYEAS